MWVDIKLKENLTLGKLKELINTGELSKFPNNTPINMNINLRRTNIEDKTTEPTSPILSIIGSEDLIDFYNYI